MAFTLPVFNVPVNVWHSLPFNAVPPFGPPALAGVLANVSLGRRVVTGTDSRSISAPGQGVGIDVLLRIMMVPAGTDVRSFFQTLLFLATDFLEVPAGSGAFYLVQDVADMAKGFANEHRLVWFTPSAFIGLPFPLP